MLSVNKAKKIYKAQSGDVVALNGVDISFKENGLTFMVVEKPLFLIFCPDLTNRQREECFF